MATKHSPGAEVRCCHDGNDHRAQVSEVHPDTGEVIGLTVYDSNGSIVGGMRNPVPATTRDHRIVDGHFWN